MANIVAYGPLKNKWGARKTEDGSVCVAGGPKKTKAVMKRDIIAALPLCNTIWKEEDGEGKREKRISKRW